MMKIYALLVLCLSVCSAQGYGPMDLTPQDVITTDIVPVQTTEVPSVAGENHGVVYVSYLDMPGLCKALGATTISAFPQKLASAAGGPWPGYPGSVSTLGPGQSASDVLAVNNQRWQGTGQPAGQYPTGQYPTGTTPATAQPYGTTYPVQQYPQTYPYTTAQRYPYNTGQQYPHNNQTYPSYGNQITPYNAQQYNTQQPYGTAYPYNTATQYPYNTAQQYPYNTNTQYPYNTAQPYNPQYPAYGNQYPSAPYQPYY